MAPTPALWALLRWTCSPVASRIPSLIAIERCENDAIRSSFQPAAQTGRDWGKVWSMGFGGGGWGCGKSQYKSSHTIQAKWIWQPGGGGGPMNQLECVVFSSTDIRLLSRHLNHAFWRDKRVKGMNCACHHNEDKRLDVPKQGLDTERTEDTRRRFLSDRAPLTVLPGNTCFFSPELSWVWEEPGCFYLWYSRTKVVIYRKPESWEETSSAEYHLSLLCWYLSIVVCAKDEWWADFLKHGMGI